jgi:translation initiation factor 1
MSRKNRASSRPVYSTESGRLCPQCQRPVAGCVCGDARPAYSGDGTVRIRRESKGRGGKTVTVIEGVPLPPDQLKALARALKKRCGVGGSTRDEVIEIQGDAREVVKRELEQRGYRVKLAGG